MTSLALKLSGRAVAKAWQGRARRGQGEGKEYLAICPSARLLLSTFFFIFFQGTRPRAKQATRQCQARGAPTGSVQYGAISREVTVGAGEQQVLMGRSMGSVDGVDGSMGSMGSLTVTRD